MSPPRILWGLEWQSENRRDGLTRHLVNLPNTLPALFRTRREAREYRRKRYGYIQRRRDLQAEPHGWKMPRVVRVAVKVVQA